MNCQAWPTQQAVELFIVTDSGRQSNITCAEHIWAWILNLTSRAYATDILISDESGAHFKVIEKDNKLSLLVLNSNVQQMLIKPV